MTGRRDRAQLTAKGTRMAEMADRYDAGQPPRDDYERALFAAWYAQDCEELAAGARAEWRYLTHRSVSWPA